MAATEPGTVLFDRYRVVRRIAAGGMGTVFEARDLVLDQTVALKRVSYAALPEDLAEETRKRVLREARYAAQLRGDPHVVAIYDVQVSDGDVWLVLEYLPSRSLAEMTTGRTRLEVRAVSGIGASVARGLAAAHARGITHRDVKPGNILIADDGAAHPPGTAKLTDFGISHADGDSTLTATGQVSGTPAYMAREVARGEDATPASDVFSLAATLYAAVEGVGPFGPQSNPRAMVYRVANDPVRPPEVAGPLGPLLMAMLDDEPTRRPDAATVAGWLDALASGAAPPGAPGPMSSGPVSSGSAPFGPAAPGPSTPGGGSASGPPSPGSGVAAAAGTGRAGAHAASPPAPVARPRTGSHTPAPPRTGSHASAPPRTGSHAPAARPPTGSYAPAPPRTGSHPPAARPPQTPRPPGNPQPSPAPQPPQTPQSQTPQQAQTPQSPRSGAARPAGSGPSPARSGDTGTAVVAAEPRVPSPAPRRAQAGDRARPAPPSRRPWLLGGGLVAVVLVVVAVVAGVQTIGGSGPAPVDSPRAISGDARAADPCALLDLGVLGRFGPVALSTGAPPSGCRADVTPADGRPAQITVSFERGIAVDGGTQPEGDLVVQRGRTGEGAGSDARTCVHAIGLPDGNQVLLRAYSFSAGIPPCDLADQALDSAVGRLQQAGVTYDPNRNPDSVLARADACDSLDAEALGRAGIGATPFPGFGSWSCSWGTAQNYASVSFNGTTERTGVAGEPAPDVAGKRTFVQRDPASCAVTVVHRPGAGPDGRMETVTTTVAQVPGAAPDQACATATDLATVAESRLPQS